MPCVAPRYSQSTQAAPTKGTPSCTRVRRGSTVCCHIRHGARAAGGFGGDTNLELSACCQRVKSSCVNLFEPDMRWLKADVPTVPQAAMCPVGGGFGWHPEKDRSSFGWKDLLHDFRCWSRTTFYGAYHCCLSNCSRRDKHRTYKSVSKTEHRVSPLQVLNCPTVVATIGSESSRHNVPDVRRHGIRGNATSLRVSQHRDSFCLIRDGNYCHRPTNAACPLCDQGLACVHTRSSGLPCRLSRSP
jgi:hypothetical protein